MDGQRMNEADRSEVRDPVLLALEADLDRLGAAERGALDGRAFERLVQAGVVVVDRLDASEGRRRGWRPRALAMAAAVAVAGGAGLAVVGVLTGRGGAGGGAESGARAAAVTYEDYELVSDLLGGDEFWSSDVSELEAEVSERGGLVEAGLDASLEEWLGDWDLTGGGEDASGSFWEAG